MTPIYARSRFTKRQVDHYYHHVVDYVVPLWIQMREHPDWMLAKHDVNGALADHMAFWFRGRLTSEAAKRQCDVRRIPAGHFGAFAGPLMDFGRAMQKQSRAKPRSERIVYVRREPTNDYYRSLGQKSGSDRRFLAREQETIDLLSAAFGDGLQVVSFEDMTADEQVRLSSTAAVLVGVHGAGLTNMLFAPADAAVVEVTFPKAQPCFERLARATRRGYTAIAGKGVNRRGRLAIRAAPEDILAATQRAYG
jgi:hypothetical protein